MHASRVQDIRQRADLTFKENVLHGRHGWLRLTPAYSVRLVEHILDEFGGRARRVLEPFSGTGTTPLCAAYRGLHAVAMDINPFLVWLGRVKGRHYTEAQKGQLELAGKKIGSRLRHGKARAADHPPLKNIERWWNPEELAFVAALRAEVERVTDATLRDLLKVAFCRTMIALSNAAFNHQSMSFKDSGPEKQLTLPISGENDRFVTRFLADVHSVSAGCTDNPRGELRIEKGDSRCLGELGNGRGRFDLLITSPPYPNRMSYIRELRPYMYWLGFLADAKGAGELDWEAIGGTWGIATSRLLSWQPTDAYIPDYLATIVGRIRSGHPKNGELMARYVHKYFDDMFHHFRSAATLIRPGGTVHYVVGNATFYGHIVPAEKLYVDQLTKVGFRRVSVRAIRKRNSKKELVEFHVLGER